MAYIQGGREARKEGAIMAEATMTVAVAESKQRTRGAATKNCIEATNRFIKCGDLKEAKMQFALTKIAFQNYCETIEYVLGKTEED